jgi:electron transfer flavoprotein alpha subunit
MAEQKEGMIEEISFSLLSEGKRLKAQWSPSCHLSAIVIGHGIRALETELGQYGADRVYYLEERQLERYQPELYTDMIAGLVKEKEPDFFLLGATPQGSDLAPRIAARLRVGLVTHCVNIKVNGDQIEAIRPVSDQYLYQRVRFLNPALKIVTFSPGVMIKENPDSHKKADVIRILPKIDQGQVRTRFVEFIKGDPKTIGLEEADVIVCGGRGVGKEAFDMIYQLANVLNGSVGGTRPVIDWGILPHERQIGQTGVEVFPTVLITCGISGANEFIVGIECSKLVVAINWDRRARIFKFADLGIIGDVRRIIPLLVDQVNKGKQKLKKAGDS